MKNQHCKGMGWTMSKVLAAEAESMDQRLFEKAKVASRLAKAMIGRQRRKAYAIKASCLRRALERDSFTCSVDTTRYPGLLLVGLAGGPRLHTHESWLFPSPRRGRVA